MSDAAEFPHPRPAETCEPFVPCAAPTDTLADTVVLLLTLTAVQRLIGFARGVLFCRWLDPKELGQWDMAWGFLLLAPPLVVLGLPGTFGRYVEYYRQRGQLRAFMRRTTGLTLLLSCTGVTLLACCGAWFAELVFGDASQVELIWLLAAALGVVIAYNFLTEFFTSLRMYRVISGLQFGHSLLFALFGLGLLLGWHASASSVIVAYALACVVSSMISLVFVRRVWGGLPKTNHGLQNRALIVKLLPFAVWVWVTNWLSNLFEVIDRYMIVHCSGLPAAEALAEVGNYHSSRVVPVLLVAIAALLGNVSLPHLSHDWETGRKAAVSDRVNLMLKLVGFGMIGAAGVILLASPVLFEVAFQGKYDGGLAVLPWTLTYCVWFGVIAIAQNYLWCAERASLGSLAMLIGLLVNLAVNQLLIPRLGLIGAVWGTTAANFTALVLTYYLSHLCGMKLDRGTMLVFAIPPLFAMGPAVILAAWIALAYFASRRDWLLNPQEKRQISAVYRQYAERFANLRHRFRNAPTAG